MRYGPTSRKIGVGVYSILYQGNTLLSMKILKDNHCPNCGVALARVRQGIAGTACGLFHVYPGIAKLVISVVNNERDDIMSLWRVNTGDVVTTPVGEGETYSDVVEAVSAVLDDMNEVIFPSDA